MSATSLHI